MEQSGVVYGGGAHWCTVWCYIIEQCGVVYRGGVSWEREVPRCTVQRVWGVSHSGVRNEGKVLAGLHPPPATKLTHCINYLK